MATRHSITTLLASCLVIASHGCTSDAPPPREVASDSLRAIEQGQLVGYVGPYGSHVWRGIPYAKPPVGALRWRAPQHPDGWEGTREALTQGDFCPQFASPLGGVQGDPGEVLGNEDCLFLDVYAPVFAKSAVPRGDAKLPVMVWIHGGGNVIGHAGFYDGGRLAAERDVVVVAIHYRLGPLGWFRHAALRAADGTPADRSGNFGTLDMIRALEWVRGNIATFGGDPGNVTIFGESAGGTDVYTLLLSPRASGLFHRAIAQSGGTYLRDAAMAENFVDDPEPGADGSSNEVLLKLLQADGRAVDRESARAALDAMSDREIAAYLRKKPPSELLAVYQSSEAEGLIDVPMLFHDGSVLPLEDATEAFARKDGWNVVPVLAGTNRDENKLFMFGNDRWVKRWFGLVPRFRDEAGFLVRADYMSQMWKARGVDEPLTAMRRSSPDVWAYRFDWDEEPTLLGADLSQMLGAAHGFEIPFVFGHYDLGEAGNILFDDDNLAGREQLTGRMMSYWTEFAKSGDPGRGRDGREPLWQRWSNVEGEPRFAILDTDAGGGVRMATESVTQASVLATAQGDPRVRDAEDRCDILVDVIAWSGAELPEDCRDDEAAQVAVGG